MIKNLNNTNKYNKIYRHALRNFHGVVLGELLHEAQHAVYNGHVLDHEVRLLVFRRYGSLPRFLPEYVAKRVAYVHENQGP